MKKIILTLSFLGISIFGFCQSPLMLQPGEMAPDVSGTDASGNTISLYTSKSKLTLVDFWASWCLPCRKTIEENLKLYKKYHKSGFQIFGINLDKKLIRYEEALKKDGIKYPNVNDLTELQSKWCKMYKVDAIPARFLIDENGKILLVNTDFATLNNYLEQTFKK